MKKRTRRTSIATDVRRIPDRHLGDHLPQAAAERGEAMVRYARLQRQHGVVLTARFFDVRQIREEEAELHGSAPCVRLDASLGKTVDTEVVRFRGTQ
jgi:hypothetical protein